MELKDLYEEAAKHNVEIKNHAPVDPGVYVEKTPCNGIYYMYIVTESRIIKKVCIITVGEENEYYPIDRGECDVSILNQLIALEHVVRIPLEKLESIYALDTAESKTPDSSISHVGDPIVNADRNLLKKPLYAEIVRTLATSANQLKVCKIRRLVELSRGIITKDGQVSKAVSVLKEHGLVASDCVQSLRYKTYRLTKKGSAVYGEYLGV